MEAPDASPKDLADRVKEAFLSSPMSTFHSLPADVLVGFTQRLLTEPAPTVTMESIHDKLSFLNSHKAHGPCVQEQKATMVWVCLSKGSRTAS